MVIFTSHVILIHLSPHALHSKLIFLLCNRTTMQLLHPNLISISNFHLYKRTRFVEKLGSCKEKENRVYPTNIFSLNMSK